MFYIKLIVVIRHCFRCQHSDIKASQVALLVNNPPANAGGARDLGSIPGSGRSPDGVHGNALWYSYWRIPWTEEPGGL